jgi:hypothetical protein
VALLLSRVKDRFLVPCFRARFLSYRVWNTRRKRPGLLSAIKTAPFSGLNEAGPVEGMLAVFAFEHGKLHLA